jgi:uncharacterized membrane protein YfcA
MALVGVAPGVMKPTALTLNILVAAVATVRFYRAGCFSWEILWPFILASVPFAFIGGAISLPNADYKLLFGVMLLYAAARLVFMTQSASAAKPLPLWAALISGMGIGLLSGLTGVGGGIFLSPLLLFMGWAETRQTSGVSAAFILMNSLAGLLGHISSVAALPHAIPILATAALIGGLIGADYGSRRLGHRMIQRLLAVVLVIAGVKMIMV